MKKILVLYAAYGGGHLAAAKSIQNYLEENYTDQVEAEIIDFMKYINKTIDKLTTGAYKEMAKKAPKLWGRVYSNSQKGLLGNLSKNSNKLMARKLEKLISEKKPDLIISTHPFSSQMISYLKRKERLSCKLATVLTDFAMHEQWLIGHENTEFFFVSNNDMKEDLIKYGVDEEKIHVTGIPLSSRFFENFNKEEIYKEFGLDPQKKVALFFGGGEFGLGEERTLQILKALIEKTPEYQIVAIAGKNEKMKIAFEKLVKEENVEDRIRVFAFSNKVPELMHIANVVVTKPGGLTSTESLACSLPLVIINPIPGQEEENAQFLEKQGAGIWIREQEDPDKKILELFHSEDKLEQMKKNTKLLAKKDSTKDICSILLANL